MSRIGTAVVRLLLVSAVASALFGLSRCVPFDVPSYAAWTGIFLSLLSLAALVKPARWLWLPTRGRALLALCAGTALIGAALVWPVSLSRRTHPRTRLDYLLPEYQAAEYHEAWARAPLARVVEAARNVSLADMPAAAMLIWLRGLARGSLHSVPPENTPLLDVMLQNGFLELDAKDEKDRVYGMVGEPWNEAPGPKVHSAEDFRTFNDPGAVRIAFDLRVVDEGDGMVRVSTETRILGADEEAQGAFERYWRLIYPGSAIIRHVWLDAIVTRAERSRP